MLLASASFGIAQKKSNEKIKFKAQYFMGSV